MGREHIAFHGHTGGHSAPITFHSRVAVIAMGVCILLLSTPATVASAEGKYTQQAPTDYTALTLEELMELDVISINVLGTHTHLEGEWMLAYSFMFMNMDGNRDGTSRLSDSDVLADFPVAPTNMSMKMHMPMVMYAPSDDLTLMAMLPYIRLEMDHVTRTGALFTTVADGPGDLKASALYTFFRRGFDRHRLIFNGEVSFPTGSIDQKDFTANRNQGKQKLPYPMQLGSGTFDLHPGISYIGQTESWGWGVDVDATIRLGENSNDYTLGNQYHVSARGDWKWTDWMAPFVKIDARAWENIDGADPDLNPAQVPTADPNRRGGERVDLLFGFTLYEPEGAFRGHRLAFQGGVPIYQSLDGPQLETDWHFTGGWQWVF